MGRLQELGEEGEGGGGQRVDKRGAAKQKREERAARVVGKRVGSHPSDRDQWLRPSLTSVLPTPAYKSKKVLLLH
jgi:hypothetical protein